MPRLKGLRKTRPGNDVREEISSTRDGLALWLERERSKTYACATLRAQSLWHDNMIGSNLDSEN